MAYNLSQQPQYPPPKRYYNAPQQQQQQRPPTRPNDGYSGASQRNWAPHEYGGTAESAGDGYDQYGNAHYGNEQYSEDAQYGSEPWPTDYSSTPNQLTEAYHNDGAGGYVYGDAPQPRQQPPPSRQRMPPPRNQAYPPRQMNGGAHDLRARQPGPGRMPAPGPRMRGGYAPDGGADRTRYRHQPDPNAQAYDPGVQYEGEYAPIDNRNRAMPSQGRRGEERLPEANYTGTRPNTSGQPDYSRQAGRPFNDPVSPQSKNFDNPFPAFLKTKAGPGSQSTSTQDSVRPRQLGRESEIYNGIVGEYISEEPRPPIPANNSIEGRHHMPPMDYNQGKVQQRGPHPRSSSGSRHPSEQAQNPNYAPSNVPTADIGRRFQQPDTLRQGPGPGSAGYGNGRQSPIPPRPGTAPGAAPWPSERSNVPGEDARYRNPMGRPIPDRSASDKLANHMVSASREEEMPAFQNVPLGPGVHASAQQRFVNPQLVSHGHPGTRPGISSSSDYSAQGPGNLAETRFFQPQTSHTVFSDTDRRQPQRQNSGFAADGAITDLPAHPSATRLPPHSNPNNGRRPQDQSFRGLERSRTGPAAGTAQHNAPELPALYRPATAESHFSDPGPRLATGPASGPPPLPRPPLPPLPGAIDMSAALGPNARSIPLPNASQLRNEYGSRSGRSSLEQDRDLATHELRSKRSGIPNRANVERPNFYPATGQLGQAPTSDFEAPAQQEQPRSRSDPDALPHHATPVQAGMQQGGRSTVPPPKPPPVRQYNNEPPPTAKPVSNARRPSIPVTQEELSRLREAVRVNPSDNKTQLILAKKLVEAAATLADEGGRADVRTRSRNQERYTLEGHKIIKKLVSSNYPDAMFYLAECYGDGTLGLQNDPKEAFGLYQTAAKLGHAAAAYRTAVCCEIGPDEGGGTSKDLQKAFQWYKRAAALGDVPATYKMGIILLKGLLGQEKSMGEAVAYLKRAAERADEENPHALHELGLLYEAPKNPGLVVRDEGQAFHLFTKAAKLGYKFSQFKLGQAYEYGFLGCTIDARNSIIWYTKAAAQGEHQSELALSGWYLTGSEGILEHSDTEAYLWARKAALSEPPLPKAMFAMGYFTEVGIGCPRSLEEAKRWYGRAAAYKFPKAQERLEELQKGGMRAQKNREKLSRGNAKQEAECIIM